MCDRSAISCYLVGNAVSCFNDCKIIVAHIASPLVKSVQTCPAVVMGLSAMSRYIRKACEDIKTLNTIT